MSYAPFFVSKRLSGPQQSNPYIWFWLKNCLKIIKIKNMSEIFSLYQFWKPLYFRLNLKSIFTYQNGLESKKLFCKIFLKLNFTFKYIWGKIHSIFQDSHRTLMWMFSLKFLDKLWFSYFRLKNLKMFSVIRLRQLYCGLVLIQKNLPGTRFCDGPTFQEPNLPPF